jgi:hypothetical protein
VLGAFTDADGEGDRAMTIDDLDTPSLLMDLDHWAALPIALMDGAALASEKPGEAQTDLDNHALSW